MRKGSMLLEFVVVLPVYLVLFAGVFLFGDLVLRTARLPSAERLGALDLGRSDDGTNGWAFAQSVLFPTNEVTETGRRTDELSRETNSTYYADLEVMGPFALRAALTVSDDYRMPAGVARGQLAFTRGYFARLGLAPVDTVVTNLYAADGVLALHSKPVDVVRAYTYNYYTLKRHRYESSEYTWRDNARHASQLLTQKQTHGDATRRAWDAVYREGTVYGVTDREEDKKSNTPSAAPTTDVGTTAKYTRYAKFVH